MASILLKVRTWAFNLTVKGRRCWCCSLNFMNNFCDSFCVLLKQSFCWRYGNKLTMSVSNLKKYQPLQKIIFLSSVNLLANWDLTNPILPQVMQVFIWLRRDYAKGLWNLTDAMRERTRRFSHSQLFPKF